MFTYQKTNRYFAQVADGLEELAAAELETLGAGNCRPAYRGVYFEADRAGLYRINYRSRLCTRVLALLLRFDCHSTKYLHKTAIKLPWEALLDPEKSFAVQANVSHSKIRHSQYAALCLKDAIVDYFRDRCGRRPSIDTRNPDVWLNLHIESNKAAISIDTSGGSLHRRGYRQDSIAAPMQETVAAAIVRLSGWDGDQPLYDPMCGSGTLLCEALMQYCRIPAGYLRKRFGFEALPDFDPAVWQRVKKEADQRIRALPPGLIGGSDMSREAVQATKANCALLPHGKKVQLRSRRFQELDGVENSVIICNPPYGIRLQRNSNMDLFMREFGTFLKQRCRGSSAYLYFGAAGLVKKIGLRPAWKKPLKSGGLDGLLVKYELY